MPDWISDLAGVKDYAPVLTILILVAVGIVKTWPWLRRIVRFLDRLIGDPENPGLLDRVANLEQQVAPILHEVKNNSGSSMKDAVDRTEAKLDDAIVRLDRVEVAVGTDSARISDIEDTITKPHH